jgi:hypothetical protein
MLISHRATAALFLSFIVAACSSDAQNELSSAPSPDPGGGAPSSSRDAGGGVAVCVTPSVPEGDLAAIEERLEQVRAVRRGPEGAMLVPGETHSLAAITIPVYFHVLRTAQGAAEDVAENLLDTQITRLNAAFSGSRGGVNTPFRFVKAGTATRTTNAVWAQMLHLSNPADISLMDADEMAAKEALHQGGPRSLNVYTKAPGTESWARFPWWYEQGAAYDGVVLTVDALDSTTLAHEVGHWLGLSHTFEGGCSVTNDHVSDTPAHTMPAPNTCPASANTCLGLQFAGLDPIHNYMNYTSDACRTEFTAGQRARMDLMFTAYRERAVTGVALTGGSEWARIPNATYDGSQFVVSDGTFLNETSFGTWAGTAGVDRLIADFDGDGYTDIALTGPGNWGSVPVAYATRNGNFHAFNVGVSNFPGWSAAAGVKRLTGDFDGDGYSDIALTGVPGWTEVKYIHGGQRGAWRSAVAAASAFNTSATRAGVTVLRGDFDRNGATDVIAIGDTTSPQHQIGLGSRTGQVFTTGTMFNGTGNTVSDFRIWATQPGAQALVADFNGDGAADIALVGGTGWASVPVALSRRDGSFSAYNVGLAQFAGFASSPGVRKVAADFNGDGFADIALLGGVGWQSIPVAYSNGNAGWNPTNNGVSATFGQFAQGPGTAAIVGDFDRDGWADIGVIGCCLMPVAFSRPNAFLSIDVPFSDPAFLDITAPMTFGGTFTPLPQLAPLR